MIGWRAVGRTTKLAAQPAVPEVRVTFKLISVLVLVVFALTLVQPAKAEAMEPTTVIAIVGVAIALIAIIVVVVIANTRDRQTGDEASVPRDSVPLVLASAGSVESL